MTNPTPERVAEWRAYRKRECEIAAEFDEKYGATSLALSTRVRLTGAEFDALLDAYEERGRLRLCLMRTHDKLLCKRTPREEFAMRQHILRAIGMDEKSAAAREDRDAQASLTTPEPS